MSEPEVLSVNVCDTVKTGEATNGHDLGQVFKNPNNDSRIFGMVQVESLEILTKLAPMAFEASKGSGKPVLIMVKSK